MVTSRMKGEFYNQVIPLSCKSAWSFSVLTEPVAAIVLLTDGLLDQSVGSNLANNRVYYPFFQSIFENPMQDEKDVLVVQSFWKDFLQSDEFFDQYKIDSRK